MDDTAEFPDVRRALSNTIARGASLVDLRMRRIESELFIPSPKVPLTPKVSVEPSVGRVGSYAVYDIVYRLGATDDTRRDVFHARVVLNLIFSAKDEAVFNDNAALEAFGAVGAVEIAHPYVRELVHTLTFRMGLPPFVLDVLPPVVSPEADAEPPMVEFQ